MAVTRSHILYHQLCHLRRWSRRPVRDRSHWITGAPAQGVRRLPRRRGERHDSPAVRSGLRMSGHAHAVAGLHRMRRGPLGPDVKGYGGPPSDSGPRALADAPEGQGKGTLTCHFMPPPAGCSARGALSASCCRRGSSDIVRRPSGCAIESQVLQAVIGSGWTNADLLLTLLTSS